MTSSSTEPQAEASTQAEGLLDLVLYCSKVPELRAEFNRLTGCAFGAPKSPLEAAIDKATGRDEHDMAQFVAFVMEHIALPLMVGGAA